MFARTANFFKKYYFVISVLFVSGILRWILILRGGQFYFPDESRYGIAQDALVLLLDGKLKTALLTLMGELAHIGFKITALIPALFENIFNISPALPAIFFSFFSVINFLLIWMIALKAGASTRVANYALLIAACCQTLLYYSRHLFPYDQAMFFGLFALYVAIEKRPNPGASFWCGTLSFLCLVTYNGYWPLSAFPMLINMLNGTKEKQWLIKRPIFLGLGFLTPLAILLMVCFLIGKDFFSDYGIYLQKIVQGNFSEGWSLPFEYFWHAEHGLILIVGLLTLIALVNFIKGRNRFLFVAIGGILFVYLNLVIPSFTHTFVVYGRTARQLMPFLALTAACGLSLLGSWKPTGRWLVNGLIAVIVLQAAWNYRAAYHILYPREFVQQIQVAYPDFQTSDRMTSFYAPLICKNNGYLAVNFHILQNRTGPLPPFQGDILMKAPHPENFLPYQYDGYPPEQRQALRKENPEMVFYKLEAGPHSDIENCFQAEK